MRIASLVSAGLFLVACRGSSSNNADAPVDVPGPVKIQDVQNDAMQPGTPVSLSGVIVTAIDSYGAKTGDIWVEEPEGGAFSGIHIFKADTSQVAMLSLGDIVDVTGAVKDEFALSSDTSGRTLTELKPAMSGGFVQVTKTGTGMVPAPQAVDALAIGMMSDPARSNEWEKWEGVLITVSNVNAISTPKCIGSACSDPTAQNFGITGVAKVESSLAAFPTGIMRNSCLATVTGVEDYFFDYLILPRTTAELTTGGTGCPAVESACGDGIDNDGNGYADCGDDNCIIDAPSCHDSTVTINGLDTTTTLPTGGVNVGITEAVCVTAIGNGGVNFWIAKQGTAGANEGMYVYGQGQMLPTGVNIGTRVEVIGTMQDYNNDMMGNPLRELNELQVTAKTGACNVTAAANGMAAALTQDAGGKPMVGSLVQMGTTASGVAVVSVGTMANHGVGQLKQGGVAFESLPDIIGGTGLPASEMGKCYASIIGIWTYDVYNNAYGLIPLAVGTGNGTATCN